MGSNLYDVLGVKKTDSHDVIKKAYRKLARETHPDKNKGKPKAEERFKEVSAAWDVLGDKEKRELYDEFGDVVTKPGFDADKARAYKAAAGARGRHVNFGGQAVDLGDLLGGMFGMGGQGGGRGGFNRGFGPGAGGFGGSGFSSGFGPTPGRDLQAAMSVDFRTAALGGTQKVTLGDGRTITVRIPEGLRDGETLKLRGQGGRGTNGGRAGDLRITFSVKKDNTFTRDGLDLTTEVEVTLIQLYKGGKIEVPTLDGAVRLTVKAGTPPDAKLRLSGKGVSRRDKKGDLFAQLKVVLPESLPDSVLSALETAYAAEASDVA